MPCFHGLAVSIHTPDGPLPEYSIQRQTKHHRITAYIPVPPAKVRPESTIPEQSTFAISITLLTPGICVPYSTPKETPDDPYPRPKMVGGLPSDNSKKGGGINTIAPYVPLTTSQTETIAAYIYFDGRSKEEVATLLRRGEETWVNSRWVSVSEGGGLAEREFLFREVGLERWLNGLDLEGNDAEIAAKIERRKKKLEKRMERKRRLAQVKKEEDSSEEEEKGDNSPFSKSRKKDSVLRYGNDKNAPLEALSDESMTDDSSDDEVPPTEATGQIKVALYRVIASGEIKRGEYSPQFDAHDDDDLETASKEGGNAQADVDHTTSFAKPKQLDPKSITTQTVTGIDPPEKPYAVFTFLYRGERQLQKMGILASPQPEIKTPTSKRKSGTVDFSNLGSLKTEKTVKNLSGYRDAQASKNSVFAKKKRQDDDDDDDDMDDSEDEDRKPIIEAQDDDDKDDIEPSRLLSPEDAEKQTALSEGVKKINLLKRQASADPLAPPQSSAPTKSPSPGISGVSSPKEETEKQPAATSSALSPALDLDNIGSPFKRARASEHEKIDVSAARKAGELFSSSLFQKPENSKDGDQKVGKKGDLNIQMQDEI